MTTKKLRDEKSKPVPSIQLGAAQTGTQQTNDDPPTQSRVEKAITELQCLNELLLAGDLDPRILEDFRDALNRVRTSAWAAQQYIARKEIDEDSSSVFSFLAGERIRVAYHLCEAIKEDLRRPDIEVPAGSIIQLYEVMNTLTEQLKGVVNRLG